MITTKPKNADTYLGICIFFIAEGTRMIKSDSLVGCRAPPDSTAVKPYNLLCGKL